MKKLIRYASKIIQCEIDRFCAIYLSTGRKTLTPEIYVDSIFDKLAKQDIQVTNNN
jgi:hypothetical protein